ARTPGYFGSIITHTTVWGLIALAAGYWLPGAAALIARFVSAWLAGAAVLQDAQVTRWFWLLPARDLFGFAVWIAGCFGSAVHWRGLKMRLDRQGRIRASDNV
ncbi:MAG: hypothetical protein JO336_21215, partial [Acidobacteriia bacterium]|nr:hypothetical protein [Terriglobia bacterium]